MNNLDSTIRRAMSEAERASIEAARIAYERGYIDQRQIGPGVWTLKHSTEQLP